MNPLLVSAIGSLGSKLIDRILPEPKAPSIDAATLRQFSQMLNQIQSTSNSELEGYLKEHGIDSWEDLEKHIARLGRDMREQIESQIGYSSDSTAGWMLNVSPEQIQLMSPRGDKVSLDSIPGLQEMAQDFHQLNMLQVLHSQTPNASIEQVVGQCNTDNQPYITWNL